MGSSAKNYKPNGDTMIIGGVLNVVGDGQIQKDGEPVDLGGETGPTEVTSNEITDATTVGKSVLTAADAAAARTAIGAGTSNLALGTTSSTAAAGDHTHTIADIDSLQATLNDLESRLAALEGGGG